MRRLWGFESQLSFEDWGLSLPLNSGENMKIIEADGAAVRGPFKQVQQIPATAIVNTAGRL
jgi:hypothetical protein